MKSGLGDNASFRAYAMTFVGDSHYSVRLRSGYRDRV